MMNVPRCANPDSSSSTSKLREIFCDGSPIIVYLTFEIACEWSCHALCVKCVSVVTEYTSTPNFCNSSYWSCKSSISVGQSTVKYDGLYATTHQFPLYFFSVTSTYIPQTNY